MDFKPIHPQKIYEQIVEQVKEMVAEGNLKPGDRLPAERVMANHLCVSRASVREALSALHLMGFVEIKPGEGTFIKQSDVNSIIQPLALMLMMERDMSLELLEVRKGLEVQAAELAVMNATDEDIENMEAIINDMRNDLEDTQIYEENIGEEADWKFHCAIAQASGNTLLMRLMNTVADTMRKTLQASRRKIFLKPGNREILFKQHLGIFEAIKKRDRDLARRKMYEHLHFAEVEMRK